MTTAAMIDEALQIIGDVLDRRVCWIYQRRYHFCLGNGWTIAVMPESADRLRIETCHWSRPAATLWSRARDHDRLAAVARAFRRHIERERGELAGTVE